MPESAGGTAAGLSGRMEGGVHVMPIRVHFAETDAGGVMHHASYLSLAERARTEMLRLLGFDQGALMRDQGLVFAVRHCEADYLQPARLDDLLEMRTQVEEIGGSSLRVAQVVRHGARDLAQLWFRLVCIRLADGRPTRVPQDIRVAFGAALQPTEIHTT